MIDPAALQRLLDEIYAAHWILWNVGFQPAELFVGAGLVLNATPRAVYAYVKIQRADGEFVLPMGPALDRSSSRRVLRAWRRAIPKLHAERTTNAQAFEQRLRRTIIWDRRVELLVRLEAKGLRVSAGVLN